MNVVVPKGISLISWVWVMVGIMMSIGGVMAIFQTPVIDFSVFTKALAIDKVPGSDWLYFVVNNFYIFMVLQAAVGVLAIYSGVKLLELRAWARSVIEGLTWVSMIYVLALGSFTYATWIDFDTAVGADNIDMNLLKNLVIGAIIFLSLLSTFAFFLMIRYLHSDIVKYSIKQSNQ